MRRALPLLLLALLPGAALRAEPADIGDIGDIESPLRAEPVPVPGSEEPFRLEPAPDERLPARPGAGGRIFAASLPVLEEPEVRARVVLVEPAQGAPFLYADQDLDGLLAADERFSFDAGAVLLRFPLNSTGLPFYPVLIGAGKASPAADHRELFRSGLASLSGTVTVAGREIRVRYPISAATGRVDLRLWGVGMDTDGDGRIVDDFTSGELDHGKAGTIVFHVGDMYLSTSRLDVAGGRAFLRVHPASDYRRFDLRPGSPVDFDYADPAGRRHRLSDLRGAVVLLDFWGTWCVHCIREMPVLRKAYEDLRDRGFEILGMDARDDLAQLQAFVAGKDAPWLHATADSVREVIEDRFRVRAFPTKVLLDRDGRIVAAGNALDAPSLYGDALLKTVEETLARPSETVQFVGRLEPGLDVEPRDGLGMGLDEVKETASIGLPVPPAPGDRAFEGKMWLRRSGPQPAYRLVLVEPAGGGAPFVYADLDLDGRLAAEERFGLEREPDGEWESAVIRFPIRVGPLDGIPVWLGRSLPEKDPGRDHRFMAYNVAQAVGKVQVGSGEVRVRYRIDLDTGEATLLGQQGMDLDGNGVFDRGLSRGEVEMSEGGRVVFHAARLGGLYLSTRSVDTASGRIVLRTHPASDYRRFDLSAGSPLPDFAFTAVDGTPRRLSELRGKVVLLDFWGSWCGPCVADLPKLRKLHETWRARGFEILGLDFEDDLETQRKFLAEHDAPWVHATAESVLDLVRRQFRVWSFPTKILLDREGRVVSVGDPGQLPLKTEEDVDKAVAEVLSRPEPAGPAEYVGRLEPGLTPEPRQGGGFSLEEVKPADTDTAGLPVPPAPGDRVFAGSLWLRRTEPRPRMVLVEPAAGSPFFYADLDLDGRLAAEERFVLEREPDGAWESATIRFALKVGAVDGVPVWLGRSVPEKAPAGGVRTLAYSVGQAVGRVRVGSREVKVRYRVDLDKGQVNLADYQAMDLDGNGTFDRGLSKGEVETAFGGGSVVFHLGPLDRLGDLYLSTRSADLATGRIELRSHPASEYLRFDLAPGAVVPDFAFTALDGTPRRLSELRGKVVLLDFWSTWCGPCVAEMPNLRNVREDYRARGFEILGLPFEDDLETQKKFLAEHDAPWVHATAASVDDLVKSRFRVWSFPTKILIDREGRVVSVGDPGQLPLRTEEDMRKAVEEALARPAQAGARTSSR